MIGTLRAGAEFFQVEELPVYATSGQGEHLFVRIEKRGITSEDAARRLARAFRVERRDVGFAGRKDRHAVARQWLSVRTPSSEFPGGYQDASLRVLELQRHRNKLRLGHLHGNRFRLGLELEPRHDAVLQRALERVQHQGLLHRFGAQRFGWNGANLAVARHWATERYGEAVELVIDPDGGWVTADPLPERRPAGYAARCLDSLRHRPGDYAAALRATGPTFRKLIASAAQSAVFNAVLDARVDAGLLFELREGDVARAGRGAPFLCKSERLEALNREVQPGDLKVTATGPLPGKHCLLARKGIHEQELEWSAVTQVDWAWFAPGALLASPGERRPLLVRVLEPPRLERDGEQVWLELCLPRGAYATELLGQIGIRLPEDRRTP